MATTTIPYGFSTETALSFHEALDRTRAALAEQGFGVLCEIDIAATLQRKLGVEVPPHVILGACNPPLAYRALGIDPDLGLLLPCNVVVRAGASPGTTIVAVIDPEAQLRLADRTELAPVAREVGAKLRDVLTRVAGDGRQRQPHARRSTA